jgi:hypothetical protein
LGIDRPANSQLTSSVLAVIDAASLALAARFRNAEKPVSQRWETGPVLP